MAGWAGGCTLFWQPECTTWLLLHAAPLHGHPNSPCRRGVVIAGLAFGVLHNSGGRNPAFAAWASLVGCAYGALLLATGSVACPALAHTLANVASAAVWKAAHGSGSPESEA